MSKGRATFRKSDVKRGIKALESAGKKVARLEISPDGRITLVPQDDLNAKADTPDSSELDGWLLNKDR